MKKKKIISFYAIGVLLLLVLSFIGNIRRNIIDLKLYLNRSFNTKLIEKEKIILGNSLIYPTCFFPDSNIKKYSFPGETIGGITEWIKINDLSKVKTLHIWVGLNNILNGYSQKALEIETQKLLMEISAYKMKVVFWSVPHITIEEDGFFVKKEESNNSINTFNHYLAIIANENNFEYMEVNRVLGLNSIYREPDGVHLNCTAFNKLEEKFLVSE